MYQFKPQSPLRDLERIFFVKKIPGGERKSTAVFSTTRYSATHHHRIIFNLALSCSLNALLASR